MNEYPTSHNHDCKKHDCEYCRYMVMQKQEPSTVKKNRIVPYNYWEFPHASEVNGLCVMSKI